MVFMFLLKRESIFSYDLIGKLLFEYRKKKNVMSLKIPPTATALRTVCNQVGRQSKRMRLRQK